MLEGDTLIGQHPVYSAVELAADRNIGRVGAVIVYAGIALGIDADAEVGFSRARDKDAQVGGKQHIGVFAYDIVGLDRAAVERHHQRAAGRVGDRAVLRQVNTGGRAQPQCAAACQRNLHRLALRGHRAAVAQQHLAMESRRRPRLEPRWRRYRSDGLLGRQLRSPADAVKERR